MDNINLIHESFCSSLNVLVVQRNKIISEFTKAVENQKMQDIRESLSISTL